MRAVAAVADDADAGADAGLPEAAGVAEVAGVSGAVVATEPLGAPDAVYAAALVSDPEVGVAGAADSVGGIGASPDPRSEASNIGDAHVPEYALSDVDEPDVLVERAAESVDGRSEAFAAVGLAACPDVAVGTERMPNPAGVLGVSGAADDLGPAVFWPRGAAAWADAPAAGAEADVAAEARAEIGVAVFAAGWPAAEDGADAAP